MMGLLFTVLLAAVCAYGLVHWLNMLNQPEPQRVLVRVEHRRRR